MEVISGGSEKVSVGDLRSLYKAIDPKFWTELRTQTLAAESLDQIISLSTWRKRGLQGKLAEIQPSLTPLRVALIGGCTLFPLSDIVSQMLFAQGFAPEMFVGEFNNYISEILDPLSPLYDFKPELIMLLPAQGNCVYQGLLTDSADQQQQQVSTFVEELLSLARKAHERSGAEIILSNFLLPTGHDLGPFRSRISGSDWNFKKLVNIHLGLEAPAFVHLCDAEFLTYRRGGLASRDDRRWFESKQLGSPALLFDIGQELARVSAQLRTPMKKVLVLDLDNTLWGGVIGDDGMDGIEIGDTSPKGEAFKAFQRYILSLTGRGVVLAVCSKNDMANAVEPFEKHPEMVLRSQHIVSFKANWNPKPDNIREIASELELGLDSFVFVDDNPAEIEIVRQFLPDVSTILLGPDPAEYVAQLQNCRHFEPKSLTSEDLEKTALYKSEGERREAAASYADMDSFLSSLQMSAQISPFVSVDIPRITQLINKSNQFNLTTRRRTEAEVAAFAESSEHACFSIRLSDRFGDHGLICVVIGEKDGDTLEIDTWLMSCRVLKRQVEDITVNEIVRSAQMFGCRKIRGVYSRTKKNGMVAELYPSMGFGHAGEKDGNKLFSLDVGQYINKNTHIKVIREDDHGRDTSSSRLAGNF